MFSLQYASRNLRLTTDGTALITRYLLFVGWMVMLPLVALTQQNAADANASIPGGPPKNKHYLSVGGKVKPPTPIATPQPALEQTPSGKPKFKGTVILKFGINEQGTVDWVRVVRSVDDKVDRAAIDVVRKWTFNPATKDGVPVPVETNAEVNLVLY